MADPSSHPEMVQYHRSHYSAPNKQAKLVTIPCIVDDEEHDRMVAAVADDLTDDGLDVDAGVEAAIDMPPSPSSIIITMNNISYINSN